MKIGLPAILFFLFVFTAGCKKNAGTPQPVSTKPTATPTIVILGSSTAAGVGATPADSCWANRVQAEMLALNSKAQFYNLAVEGYTTYQAMPTGFNAANRPSPDTARNITKALSYKPTLVLISFPSNDISDGFSNSEIVRNYNVITQKLDSAKIAYIIFSTQPRDFTSVTTRMQLNTLNDTVMSVFPNNVSNFLDTLSTSTFDIKPAYDSGDGIHLNDAGHTIIYNYTQVHPIFKSFLQSCK
jgi:lysophospholipase L1-like esterase